MLLGALLQYSAAIALPGIELAAEPQDLEQVAQVLRLRDELAHLPPHSVSAAAAKTAHLNLYGNYTLTQIPPPMAYQNFIPGVRVQIIANRLYYVPVPAEVSGWLTSNPQKYKDEFAASAAHLLAFLSQTLEKHQVPDVDVTFAIGDFCFGFARAQPETWGLGMSPMSVPDNHPPAALTSTAVPPVLTWNSARTGKRTCNALTTTTYDWNWPGSMPAVYDGSPWEQRQPILGWRGSLIGSGARARAVLLGMRTEGLDVKIAGGFDCGKFVQEAGGYGGTPTHCPNATANFIELAEQQKIFKYILDVDGGGSTWRFKSLLSGGWTIFKIDSPNEQFWFSELVPFVHYIPVDEERLEDDLPAKLQWAREHDAECKQIAANAKAFANEKLTWDRLHWQQYAALAMLSTKMAGPIPLDPAMSRFCCKDVVVAWAHLATQCKDDAVACATEVPKPAFVREEWKQWGAAQPTSFPPWWATPTQLPGTTPPPGSFLRR
jgi:hypothetical protein